MQIVSRLQSLKLLGSNFNKLMRLLKTQKEMFVVFFGKILQRKQRVIPCELVQSVMQGCPSALGQYTFIMGAYWNQKGVFSRMEVTATQWVDWDQCWDFHPQKSHPIGVEDLVLGLNECENSHAFTTATTGSKNSQKEANNQTDNQNQCSFSPKFPSLPVLGLG